MSFELLLIGLLLIGLLMGVVFFIFLQDRLNALERLTQEALHELATAKAQVSAKGGQRGAFLGLSGKDLWDALSGTPPEGISAEDVEDIRPRYAMILQSHIEGLFQEGVMDGKMGLKGEAKNTRLVSTLKSKVDSWIPSAQANTIYQCGIDSLSMAQEDLARTRAALDEACKYLFERAGIEHKGLMSSALMPPPATPGGTASAAPAA